MGKVPNSMTAAEIGMLKRAPDRWEHLPHFRDGARYVAASLYDWGYIDIDHREGKWRRTDAGLKAVTHFDQEAFNLGDG
ncbi:hypothetical protein SAMN05444161_2149 [Rhizobiales bacterium GAS191]|jgi:hypothetical protein|nr:hypothetical protein SAMN05519103_01263 [Rhizobiales bacterium GAS113]SEC33024.1 hypothetical protein SAMN05519104_1172 [Rhizobiales bacterium GAS188]SEC93768.1 hypothetical protein SAMN05444161_2149 [Rhizobiales bacterium GAS191]